MAMTKCTECDHEISTKAEKCPKCGAPRRRKTSAFTWTVTILIIFIAVAYFSSDLQNGTSGTSAPRPPSPHEIAAQGIKLDYNWSKVGFDNVMEATFTVANGSQYPIKDIEVTCNHFAKSGTKIDSNRRTIFDVVPANKKKTFQKFNMGFIHSQVEKSSCEVTSFKMQSDATGE
ncbi:MAG TPA: hypothetical protein VH814_10775 [Steroidobacteraceae bacterium]|jgi:RNA polymerase subunit RPABC4/transcription elongation factor Spt4